MVKGFLKATLYVTSLRDEEFVNKETGEKINWSVVGLSDGMETKEFNISPRLVYRYDVNGKKISEQPLMQLFNKYDFGFDYDSGKRKISIVSYELHKN